jgi:uncharacterized protein (DUF2141 family)
MNSLSSIFFSVIFIFFSSSSFQESKDIPKGEIILEITGFRNDVGMLRAGLYSEKDEFLKKPSLSVSQAISDKKCRIVIPNQSYGKYAIGLLHDENENTKMDYNWAKIPKEGYGISNNPKVYFSAPSFDDAKFILKEKSVVVKIEVKYF